MDSMVILSANHVTVIYLEQFLKSVIMTQEPVGANQIIWDRNVSYLKVRFQSYVNNGPIFLQGILIPVQAQKI